MNVTNHLYTSVEGVSETAPSLSLNGSLNVDFGGAESFSYELSLFDPPNPSAGLTGSMSVLQSNGARLDLTPDEQFVGADPTTALNAVFQSPDGATQSYTLPIEGLYIPWGNLPALE